MIEPLVWRSAAARRSLVGDDLHIWKLQPDLPGEGPASSRARLLSDDEYHRAARLRDDVDRARFVSTREAMRTILAGYLNTHPATLVFRYGPRGKPELGLPHARLQFNLSHSGDIALLAVSRGPAVGVDVEKLASRPKLPEIARRVFTPEQIRRLERTRGSAWIRGFFENWTAMEAGLKALGLSVFDHDLAPPGGPPALRQFIPHPGYVAAVAAPADPGPPPCWGCYRYPQMPAR